MPTIYTVNKGTRRSIRQFHQLIEQELNSVSVEKF